MSVDAPTEECYGCGAVAWWTGPRYAIVSGRERLLWDCATCGATVTTQTHREREWIRRAREQGPPWWLRWLWRTRETSAPEDA